MNLPEHIRYVALEGVIGVGKTSLASMLYSRWKSELGAARDVSFLEENFIENPFLEKFYAKPDEYAFQTQLFFLISRQRELLGSMEQNDLFRRLTISDYTFDKDRIFALQNLTDDEFSMYDTVAGALKTNLPKPDFIIYLQAGVDTLLKRIHKRNIEMERSISADYLMELKESFDHYFWHYSDCPVLIINTDTIDFVHNENHFKEILKMIETWPNCTTYFAPGESLL